MRWLMHLISPLIFHIANALFRTSLLKKSQAKHRFVMKVFRYAADNGSTRALSVYGHLLHFRGDGVQNRIQGGIYLQRAADQGDMKAQYQMGRIFEDGFEHYFQPNAEKARHYYELAAKQGHQLALARMVDIYTKGELAVEADEENASHWRALMPELPQR